MRWYPSKEMIKLSWEKYSLIVIGNIVFFLLLYFISYRPNNAENRSAEFLSMAQAQENMGRNEAAMVLYEKVFTDYPKTRAAGTAKGRIKLVKKLIASPPKPEPELVQPRLDLETMLTRKPSVYMAAFLAEHYNDDPMQTPKIREAINKYLRVAVGHEGIDYRNLKKEREFQTDFFQKELFSIKAKCVIVADWFYDDFYVKNTNFFTWRNVNITLTVEQGDKKAEKEIRIPFLASGDSVEILEFRVRKRGGGVKCKGKLTSEEGASSWSQKM